MSEASTIGLDLAKNVFQVHGIDREGRVVVARRLRRSEVLPYFAKLAPCLVGMEACATSHYWAREIAALGHAVRLMPAAYVKAYVKRSKTDAADAAAICEAVTRPTMRFVAAKSAEQQSALMLHRTRDLLVRQRAVLVNALRGHEPAVMTGPPLTDDIRASGHATAPKGRTHDCTRPTSATQKTLANQAPSTHDPGAHSSTARGDYPPEHGPAQTASSQREWQPGVPSRVMPTFSTTSA